jgi:predicted transposase/invertase (TIGR01784 family)
MPLFIKQEHELETHFDKWLYFLKYLDHFDHIPTILNEPLFQKAFATLEEANLSPEQREQYQKSLLTYWELKGVVETAREEGLEEGLQKGREEGKLEGIREGILQTARMMKQQGFTTEMIQRLTGLTQEEVERL